MPYWRLRVPRSDLPRQSHIGASQQTPFLEHNDLDRYAVAVKVVMVVTGDDRTTAAVSLKEGRNDSLHVSIVRSMDVPELNVLPR